MSQKRHPDEGKERSDEVFPEEKRQAPALRRVIREVMRAESISKFQIALEPLLRRVVSIITSYVYLPFIAYVISLLQFQEYLQRLHTFRNGKISSKIQNLLL
jgi:hypothetical protein